MWTVSIGSLTLTNQDQILYCTSEQNEKRESKLWMKNKKRGNIWKDKRYRHNHRQTIERYSRSFCGISGNMSLRGVVQVTPWAVRLASVVRSLPMALNTHCSDPSTDGRLSIISDSWGKETYEVSDVLAGWYVLYSYKCTFSNVTVLRTVQHYSINYMVPYYNESASTLISHFYIQYSGHAKRKAPTSRELTALEHKWNEGKEFGIILYYIWNSMQLMSSYSYAMSVCPSHYIAWTSSITCPSLIATYRPGCGALELVWHDLRNGGAATRLVADPVLWILGGISTVTPQGALVLQWAPTAVRVPRT